MAVPSKTITDVVVASIALGSAHTCALLFSAFCKTLIVRNPVQLAIMHLRRLAFPQEGAEAGEVFAGLGAWPWPWPRPWRASP